MYAYIYSYINKFNGHRYIGKTNNPDRRRREHLSNAHNPGCHYYQTLWCQKIRQYGYENFDFVILEVCDYDQWRERERYWIQYYNTFNGPGYNSTPGGEEEDNILNRLLTEEEAKRVRDALKTSTSKQYDIALQFGISQTLLSNINLGLRYRDDCEQYPLRKNYKTEEDYEELYNLLKYSTYSFREIAEKLNIGISTVKKINYGKLRYDPNKEYPIRPRELAQYIKRNHYQLQKDRTCIDQNRN